MEIQTSQVQDLAQAHHAPARSGAVRTIFAGSIGNTVEWFDWSIYTVFAIYFGKQFFPGEDSNAALLSTFAVFAIGFFMRPLGGWLIGAFSGRYGRRSALTLCIMMMAGSSFAISILPTYAQIGIWAPVLMTAARMVQGLSVGGEYGAATTYLTESAPPARRGFYGSFLFCSIAAGLLLASGLAWLMTRFMTPEALHDYGWRIPFFLGGCGSVFGFWIRHGVNETQAFTKMKAAGEIRRRSLDWVWQHHRGAMLRLMGSTVLPAFSFYLFVSYMPVYAMRKGGATPDVAFQASTISIALFMLALPLCGALSDRFGRRPQLLVYALANLLFLYPVVSMLNADFWTLLLIECFGLMAFALYASIAPSIMAEWFDTQVRGVGIGAGYNLVVALLGGTTPYLLTWLSSRGQEGWFFLYVGCGAFITLLTFCKTPETRGMPLR
ncbi:MFS transporter [Cupriavidus necator]|uniref:MFS transporter n=1 Tax=Cupriavidus necator TaxID=106590 RepID=UPI0005B3599E|nr:MFS transporter [Cupriavidus necator]